MTALIKNEAVWAPVKYEAACKAVAAARSVDEVKEIADWMVAARAYAKQAQNRDLEADACEIRLRAVRRLGELIAAQAATVGLNQGAAAGGTKSGPRGLLTNPRDLRPTLKGQGINKTLAHHARVLSRQTPERFEQTVAHARDSVARGPSHRHQCVCHRARARDLYGAQIPGRQHRGPAGAHRKRSEVRGDSDRRAVAL
jgi:hypothetical protein